jgi:hypothetical protein
MTVIINFDGSLSEECSGACFTLEARDQQHARQVADWLRSKVKDKTRTFISAHVKLPQQTVAIELFKEPDNPSN